MKEMVKAKVEEAGVEDASFVEQPFDYMSKSLSEVSV
jgi:phycobilisome core component